MTRSNRLVTILCSGILCFFGSSIAGPADSDYLIDMSPTSTASASSVLESEGVRFVPQWAVDRIMSDSSLNSFISKREMNPWWRLDFGRQETISNVAIAFKPDDSTRAIDVRIVQMTNLIVYVDDNADATTGAHVQCNATYAPKSGDRLLRLACADLVGRYVHVVVQSLEEAYLALSEVVFNLREAGAFDLHRLRVDVQPYYEPGQSLTHPLDRIFDGYYWICGMPNASTILALVRFDLPEAVFVIDTQVYLELTEYTRNYQYFIGSHRTASVDDNRRLLNAYSSKRGAYSSFKVSERLLGDTVYIRIRSFIPEIPKICEFFILNTYSYMDIYGQARATALNELEASSMASKALDRSNQTAERACFRSFKRAQSWWQAKFKEPQKISYIVIRPLQNATALREMHGFAVYVGNWTIYSGNNDRNERCHFPPMVYPLSSGRLRAEIRVTCFGQPTGTFVHIVASDRSTSPSPSLSLCEVEFYNCSGMDPFVETSRDVTVENLQEATLTCSASGCPPPSIEWIGPDGETVNVSRHDQDGLGVTSAITVRGNRKEEGRYTCTAYNGRATNSSRQLALSVYPLFVTTPTSVGRIPGQDVFFNCSAGGYPIPSITWTSLTGDAFVVVENFTSSGIATSRIHAVVTNSTNERATFLCTASNGLYRNVSAQADMSALPFVRVWGAVGKVRDTLSLFCNASGIEAQYIKWYKGADRISGTTFSPASNGVESTLTLSNVQLSDGSDNYYCEAGRPGYSHTMASARATVGVLGDVLSFVSQTLSQGSSSLMTCTFAAAPRPSSGELRLNDKILTNVTRQTNPLTNDWTVFHPIAIVTVRDGGDYVCIGKISPSINTTAFATISVSSVLFAPPQSTALESGKTKIVACSARGFPIPMITWQKSIGGLLTNVNGSETVDVANREKTSIVTLVGDDVSQAGSYRCKAKSASPSDTLKTSPYAVVTAKPILTKLSVDTFGIRGESASLVCRAAANPVAAVSWSFRGSPLRFGVVGESYAGGLYTTSSLNLSAVNAVEHGGHYTCRGQNSAGDGEPIYIPLNFRPRVIGEPANKNVPYSEALFLTCQLTAYPASQYTPISWYHNSVLLSSSFVADWIEDANDTVINSTLTINDVNEDDGGNYTCFDGSSPSPAIISIGNRFVLDPQDETAFEGTAGSMTCRIIGYPPGNIIWQKSSDGGVSYQNVHLDDNVQVNDEMRTSKWILSNLTITKVQRSDAVLYRCHSMNISSSSALMDVHYAPFIVSTSSGSRLVALGSSFNVSCVVDGRPVPTIDFYRIALTASRRTSRIQSDGVDYDVVISSDDKKATLIVSNALVSYSGHYFCRVSSRYGDNDSDVFTVLIEGPPASIDPSTVTIVKKTTTSIALNWTAPYDGSYPIHNYTLSLKRAGTSSGYLFVLAVNNATLEATITGLRVYTTYRILIIASNAEGAAQGTVPLTVSTEPGVPLPPRNFRALIWNSTAIFVEWDPPLSEWTGRIRYYHVYYESEEESFGSPSYKAFGRNTTSDVVSVLRPFVRYVLYVRAVNEWDDGTLIEGPSSSTLTLTTPEDAPGPPQNVSGETIVNSTSTLRVVWTEPAFPNGIIRKHTIFYKEKHGDVTLSKGVVANQMSSVLDNLALFTTYVIQVQAHTIKPGQLSDPVEGTTDQGLPSAPRHLAVSENGTRSVSLAWTVPATPRGIITRYTIFYSGNKTYMGQGGKRQSLFLQSSLVVSPSFTAYTVDNMAPDTRWAFSIAGSTVRGVGDVSVTVYGKTLSAEPSGIILPPANPSKLTTTTAVVTLIEPSQENGEIGHIDILVAAVTSISDVIDFRSYQGNATYSANLPVGAIYVAARFSAGDALPSEFVLGSGETANGYTNGPLKSGIAYQYAVRAHSAENSSLVAVSNPLAITTPTGCSFMYILLSASCGAGGLLVGIITVGCLFFCLTRNKWY